MLLLKHLHGTTRTVMCQKMVCSLDAWPGIGSRKTVQCCLENLYGRAIELIHGFHRLRKPTSGKQARKFIRRASEVICDGRQELMVI